MRDVNIFTPLLSLLRQSQGSRLKEVGSLRSKPTSARRVYEFIAARCSRAGELRVIGRKVDTLRGSDGNYLAESCRGSCRDSFSLRVLSPFFLFTCIAWKDNIYRGAIF